MFSRINKRMKSQKGFTLIELLVVIIIIAILAAIAIPTFLGQRNKAHDAAAKSLVRNAMTAVESAYVDTRSFITIGTDAAAAETALQAIEPSITFDVTALNGASTAATSPAGTSLAADNIAEVGLESATVYQVGTISASEKTFGVVVDKNAGNTFYVDGVEKAW
jgi:type IV pilus assembly protein PilA